MMPMANAFVSSVMHTRGLGSAAVEISAESSVDGVDTRLTGTGGVDLGRGFGNILWTDAGGESREIVNDVAVFVQSDGPGSTWTRLPEGQKRPTTALTAPLAGLGALSDVASLGTEDVGGRPATHYAGKLPADAANLAALGLTDEQIARLAGQADGATIDVSAWVDSASRIVRVDRSVDLPGPDGDRARPGCRRCCRTSARTSTSPRHRRRASRTHRPAR